MKSKTKREKKKEKKRKERKEDVKRPFISVLSDIISTRMNIWIRSNNNNNALCQQYLTSLLDNFDNFFVDEVYLSKTSKDWDIQTENIIKKEKKTKEEHKKKFLNKLQIGNVFPRYQLKR